MLHAIDKILLLTKKIRMKFGYLSMEFNEDNYGIPFIKITERFKKIYKTGNIITNRLLFIIFNSVIHNF